MDGPHALVSCVYYVSGRVYKPNIRDLCDPVSGPRGSAGESGNF
jgi:hypothetical protein